MKLPLRPLRFGMSAALMLAVFDGRMPVLAASPLDEYYKQQAIQQGGAQAAPVDNDQYYTAPGQYNQKYYGTPGQYTAPPTRGSGSGCNSIGDSPQCLGD